MYGYVNNRTPKPEFPYVRKISISILKFPYTENEGISVYGKMLFFRIRKSPHRCTLYTNEQIYFFGLKTYKRKNLFWFVSS